VSGSKVVVHMGTDGHVISHESSLRDAAARRFLLRGTAMLRPEEARRIVEDRLRKRGVYLTRCRQTVPATYVDSTAITPGVFWS